MSLLPHYYDLIDQIYDTFDRFDNPRNFPFLIVPQYGRRTPRHNQALRNQSKTGDFQVAINVQSFKPEEISVKVKGREIVVEGKHEEREDEHGFISRQFQRRYVLPEEYDMDTVATTLSSDGLMTIKAQKPQQAIEAGKERIIPIERVAAAEQPKAVENGEKNEAKK